MKTYLLTDELVKTLVPEGDNDDQIFFDSQQQKFGCRVRKGVDGDMTRTWVIMYRVRDGGRSRPRRRVLGAINAMDVAQAREQAGDMLSQVRMAKVARVADPYKREAKMTPRNFLAMANEYIAFRKTIGTDFSAATERATNRYLTKAPYFGALHTMDLGEIELSDVATCLDRITKYNGQDTHNQARGSLSKFFKHARKRGWMKTNPVADTEKHKRPERRRNRALNLDELAAVWKACDDGSSYGRIVRLLILTGARLNEIAQLPWCEIGTDNVWRLPKKCSLTGKRRSKNGHPNSLTLPSTALELLGPRDNGHVFPEFVRVSAKGKPSVCYSRYKKTLDAKLPGVKPWRIHDLRHSAETGMKEAGIDGETRNAVLNHVEGKSGYDHAEFKEPKRRALLRWSETVAAAVEGRSAKVVALAS